MHINRTQAIRLFCLHVFLWPLLWYPQSTIRSEEFHFDLPETLPYPEYVERNIIGYPQNLYWGDMFYIKVSQKNISESPFVVFDTPLAVPFSRRNIFMAVTSGTVLSKLRQRGLAVFLGLILIFWVWVASPKRR